jgi:hypothetical protein
MVTLRFRKAISAFTASVIPMIAIGGAVLGVARPAEAGDQELRVTGFTSVGTDCEATFTQNPAVIKDVTNVNVKIGGPIGAIPDPGFWHINSPTVVMPDAGTGVHHVVFKNGVPHHEYDESNTVAHNGPFSSGTWTVNLTNVIGAACSVYDDHVQVTFTLVS